jgi:hypothetical protein
MSGDSKYVQVFAAIAAGMDIPSIVETYDWITWLDVQQAAKRALLLEMSSNTRPKLRTDSTRPAPTKSGPRMRNSSSLRYSILAQVTPR